MLKSRRVLAPVYVALAFCSSVAISQPSTGQSQSKQTTAFDRVTTATPLPNGIDIRDGAAHLQITALRDDVLRIRISRSEQLPEDASWAVLSDARHSKASVTPEDSAGIAGFATSLLHVSVNRGNGTLTIRDRDGNILQQDARPIEFHGDTFRFYKTMPVDEHYFGLGDKTGPLDRREQAFTLWNTDNYGFQESTDPLYKSIPYFMGFRAGRAYGVLMDNTWRSSFDFGKELRDVYSFGAENGPVDYYFFYGPTPKQVVETYAWLTGTSPLPPLWTLGYQQSRYSYYPQSRVMEIADRLRADHIPADAIYLDIDYQEKNRPFTIDKERFPDFPGMVSQLSAKNFHLVAITDLHIAKLPNQGYVPYDSGIAGNHFVHNPDGSVYSGLVWPGPSVFPDFTRQQSREWWGTLYYDFSSMGVAGFWNDMNEPSVFDGPGKTMPLDVVHRIDEPGFAKRTATHAEIHNVFGMENSRGTYEGLRKLNPNLRPFVLTRASYAGGQRYAATWTGDNSSTWNHLRMTTPMLENLGLSGFAFSGADVGGFAGTPQKDLLTKWLQVAAFQPIDRNHTEKNSADQEPWVGGIEAEDIRRRYIEERYRLMPYLYTLAEETSRTGLPMVRPLFLEFPDAMPDRHPIDIDASASQEFLLGHDLLIAAPPFPDKMDDYDAEFPSTGWYNYWTGEKVSKPAAPVNDAGQPVSAAGPPLTTRIHPELATLPIFVRGGAILPTAPLTQSTVETPQGPLTLRVYAGNDCKGTLYLDDGKSYDYQHGSYLRMDSTCQVTNDGLQIHLGEHHGSYPAWWKDVRLEVYGWSPKENVVTINGKPATTQPEKSTTSSSLLLSDNGKGIDVQLK
ncbi:MAG TPA: TIM-barrel domain-containing protein [Pseudacidobacterium sp.]|nr:TIM-barrel domain-containing protein [Pseudacidobacterium sp.]